MRGRMICRLSDIAEITMGQSPQSRFYNFKQEGMPLIQGARNFGIRYPFLDIYTTHFPKKAKIGDILLSVRAPAGRINFARVNVCIGRGLCALRMKNGNQDYLYYLLQHYIAHLQNQANGTVFEALTKKDIENLEVDVVSDPLQQRLIGNILGAYDKKIENNSEINNNLEA